MGYNDPMPTAHRPGKENAKAPKPLLDRFITAIDNQNLPKVRTLLAELEKSPPPGMWMHSALAHTLKIRADNQIEYVDCLFKSPLAPKDSAQADFIITAIKESVKPEVMQRLLQKGFTPRKKGCKFLFDLVERGGVKNLDPQWIHPHHLHEAEKDTLIRACAVALCQNASAHWKKTLSGTLPDPVPTAKITQRIVDQVIRNSKNIPHKETFEWAKNNQWFSRHEAVAACTKAEKTYSRSPNALLNLSAFQAHLEGEAIQEQTQTVYVAPARKHRL
jgi:hypothetical protein